MKMIIEKVFLYSWFMLLLFSAEARRYKIIGYVSGEHELLADRRLSVSFTHLHYTFGKVENGVITLSTKDETALAVLNALKTYNKNLKVLLSIGGENGSAGFSSAVATSEGREKLSNSILEVITQHRLDGIELHWIFQAGGKFENSFNRNDQHNYTLLMELLRSKMDKKSIEDKRARNNYYILSMAGATGRQYLVYSELNQAHVYLDYITLQTYGYACTIVNGGGVVKGMTMTSHNSNLYASRADQTFKFCVDANINEYTTFNIPSRKLVMSVLLYAKTWSGVLEEDHGLYKVADSVSGVIPQKEAIETYTAANGYVAYWDKHAQAGYLFNEKTQVFVSMENAKSIRKKTSYTRRHKMGGVACVDYGMDDSNKLIKKVNKGLRRPAITFSLKKSYEPRNPTINKRVQKKRMKEYNAS